MAFQARKNPSTLQVDIVWRLRAHDHGWRGMDGNIGTAGFIVLPRLPIGDIHIVDNSETDVMNSKYRRQFFGTGRGAPVNDVHKLVNDESTTGGAEWDWLLQVVETKKMPIHSMCEQVTSPGNWGCKGQVGVPGKLGVMQISLPTLPRELWILPERILNSRREERNAIDLARVQHERLPNVCYSRDMAQVRIAAEQIAQSTQPARHQGATAVRHAAEQQRLDNEEEAPLIDSTSFWTPADYEGFYPRKSNFTIGAYYIVGSTTSWTLLQVTGEPYLLDDNGHNYWAVPSKTFARNGRALYEFNADADAVEGNKYLCTIQSIYILW